ncbi:MAG TPA: tyrosine-type recombinase/integrase [Candidatus Angelobacter sp.]|nr:tyrosine-type recombinase/integrase [Candidatus Angelobacter sp.]
MLHVYTRHLPGCEHACDPHWRRCHCPKWIRGLLLNGEKIRRSAQTHSWENAEKLARKLEADVDPERVKIEARREVTLREAVETFLGDQKARGLGLETQKKYRGFLERQFLVWAAARKMKFLAALCPAELTRFRAGWSNGETTTHRKHEMLASFFRFCQRNELMGKNPMDALKKPKTPDIVPTDYFLPEEFEKIVAATRKYEFGGGIDCRFRGLRLRAMALLMRWAGLSILDATKLERAALSTNEEGDDEIFLYRAKTGVPVYVVIPPDVAELLRSLPNSNPRYFFWSGNGDPRSARKALQRSFWKLFQLANIRRTDGSSKRCHPHMFRDTFAVELLLAGNPIDQVSLLLGHSSVKITERHYAPFCKARQQQLTAAVKRSWARRETRAAPARHAQPGPSRPPLLIQ